MSNEIPATETPVQAEEKTKIIGHYALSKTIGEGTFGKVKLSTHTLTGEKVAIKILEKDKITDVNDVERVAREIHILKLIRHPNIIQLYEIIETPKQLYLIMEYASGGELFEYIVANNRIKEKEACRFFKQIIGGVEYIHKLNVVHRDLKPENLLLDYNMNLKIVDFGLSNTYKDGQSLKTACGSPCYAAPEMIAGKRYNGLQVDIWSCGVILFAMICGYLPFEDANTSNLYKKILNGDFHIPKFVSAEARDLLKCILNTDPQKRYTIQDIRNHPWYNLSKSSKEATGIVMGLNPVPVDTNVLQKLESFNFSLSYAKKCIEANKHNHVTTTYYLLLQEHLRSGGSSNADLSSPTFVSTLNSHTQEDEGSSTTQPRRKISVPSPVNPEPIGTTPTHKLNQSVAPTAETELNKLIAKPTPIANVKGLNLNNLDTSLTKEFENKSVISNANSAKNKPQSQSISAKTDKSSAKERPETSYSNRANIKKNFFSPTPKNESNAAQLIHARHTSNPEVLDPHFMKDKDLFEKKRKESDVGVRYATEHTPRQIAERNAATKKGNPHSERYHTEGYNNIITEAEIIYESPGSGRQTPEKTASTKYSENEKRNRKTPSPKPKPTRASQGSHVAAKGIYTAKVAPQKQTSLKSPRKAQDKSLNVSLDSSKALKDNYMGPSVPKKNFVSPRSSTLQDKSSLSNSLSTRKGTVSASQGFTAGALKEKLNNTSVVDRLSNPTSGMKVHKGPFHLNSITTKNPKYIMNELAKVLESNRIHFRNLTKYSLKCEKDTNKFEIEVNSLQNHDSVYLLKFLKQSGDITKSNEICSLIYRSLDM